MKKDKTNDFSTGSVSRAILTMAAPITLAELVNILYNLVDRMYIGHIGEGSGAAFAGLGVCLPFTMLVAAFARLCGDGGAPLASIERGRGDLDLAGRIQGNGFLLLIVIGALLTGLGNAFLEPMLRLFGAEEDTLPYAAEYCRIYITGSVFVLMSLGLNPYINAQGFAKVGMLTVVIGAAVNIVLDPVFIFLLDMGVAGAALASVLAQLVSAVWVLAFLTGKRAILPLRLRDMAPDLGIIGRIVTLGFSSFVMGATNMAVQSAANNILSDLGGSVYLGVQTAIASVREVVQMPVQGISAGARPVLGYNYGAGERGRVKEGIRFMTKSTVAYTALAWALLLALPGPIISVFVDDAAILEEGVLPFRIYYAAFVFMSLQMSGQSTFVALGHAREAIFFSLLRKIFLVVPLMLILPNVGGLGVLGVFLAEPISDVLGGTAAYATMMYRVYRRL